MVSVQVADLKVTLEDHEIEASVEEGSTTSSAKANTAEITLWNINDTYYAALKNGATIELCAGYADGSGVIFHGTIQDIDRTRDGADQKTVITVLDSSVKTRSTDKITMNFFKGALVADGLRKVISLAGIAEGLISIPDVNFTEDTTNTATPDNQLKFLLDYENGALMRDQPTKYKTVKDCTRFLVVNNLAYFVPWDHCMATVILLSYSTGLLTVEKIKKNIEAATGQDASEGILGDYKITSYLNYEITLGTVIQVQSDDVNGNFRVESYKHTISKTDFTTEMTVVTI
ncbi:MAG: hypothetical protein LUQ71_10230 [Methanoregula sp.]|nr:hypothetical protein [Methanoregula sp.]